ncbi:E3 ubiquitin-protein ligase Midline-1 isoform X1 [Misgurnus anguillicaudatus]|uniref:E3 ubiquitin-protein ligase Midline-1 isoform X1 n=1 Tax=Misgurnus anguillicaudatus TaxID=75329 RepID=UPI003CCF209B
MDSLDKELICAVCQDIFEEPVTLPCGHNYCERCVKDLKRSMRETEDDERARTRYYTCPLCLSPCDSRVELKKNTVLSNIIDKYQSKKDTGMECSVCKGEQKLAAEKVCIKCDEYYCTVHVMPHLENNTLRQHVLIDPVANTSRLCKVHGKELELFCTTDSTALCVYCMLPSEAKHLQGHNVVKLSDSMDSFKEECKVKLDCIKANLSKVQDGLSILDEQSSATKVGHIKVKCNFFECLLDLLNTQEEIENQQQESTKVLSRMRLFLSFEEKAWQKRFSVDLVQEGQSVRQKAERMNRLRSRLLQAHETLGQAQNFHDPLILLQTLKNTDWTDLFDEKTCENQISETIEWNHAKPTALSKISPLLQSIRKTFAGEDIMFNSSSAHHRLKFNPERTTVWLTDDGGLCSASLSSEDFYCVVGEASFCRGIHYWEVDVASVHSWAVGVSYRCQQDRSGLGRNDLSWALHYSRDRRQFCAHHDWLQFSFSDSGLPARVGVYLDMDSGFLSFYDAVNIKHLYTFYCDFQAPVFPAFCLSLRNAAGASQQMKIINPTSNKRLGML